METASNIHIITSRPKREHSLKVLFIADEKPLLLRLFNAVWSHADRTKCDTWQSGSAASRADSRAGADFRFLETHQATPFAIRLARELSETVRAISRDPVAFISAITENDTVSPEKRKRVRAGISVAVAFYALVLSAIYASYIIFRRVEPSAQPVKHL